MTNRFDEDEPSFFEVDLKDVNLQEVVTIDADDPDEESDEPAEATSVTFETTTPPVIVRPLKLPVGNVICYGIYKSDLPIPGTAQHKFKYVPTPGFTHMAQTKLWWVHETLIPELKDRCKIWTENGFTLHFGTDTTEEDFPEVITKPWQERKVNGHFTEGRHDRDALVVSYLTWFTIDNPAKALEFMQINTNIPVAVAQDPFETDPIYKEAFAKANELFQYYFEHQKPFDYDAEKKRKMEVE